MPKQLAWSYSTLTNFETCPYQYYRLKVKKDVKEAPSQAMQDGIRQHEALEHRVAKGRPLPPDMKQWEPMCRKLVDSPLDVRCETPIALTPDLKRTEYFAKDVWLRAKIDVEVVVSPTHMRFIDYKTGKRKKDSQQLMLFAAVGFAIYPDVDTIDTAFYWLPDKAVDKERFTRERDEAFIWGEFEPRVIAMEEARKNETFPCKPSGLCRGWCPVKDCEHWEPKK
tara:strand:+ start:92 stop:763 length:672 start_codon:yes stop_codon:yes gene_type:complete